MGRSAIIGYGEIGSAIAALYRIRGLDEPRIHDPALGYASDLADCDVVHVCVPATAVGQVIRGGGGRLWIVHSTVPVGTCRVLASSVENMIVHAPVRGIHPDLVRGLETFVMPIGGPPDLAPDKVSVAKRAAIEVLAQLGVKAVAWGSWEETELAKLLCTMRYGFDILFMRHAHELCEAAGVDFERVYTEWTKQYSDGYEVLGQWFFHRPVLKPMPGKIGGHCVGPNAALLAPKSTWARTLATEAGKDWKPAAVKPARS